MSGTGPSFGPPALNGGAGGGLGLGGGEGEGDGGGGGGLTLLWLLPVLLPPPLVLPLDEVVDPPVLLAEGLAGPPLGVDGQSSTFTVY
jgi:hypothetical protein